MMSLPQSHIERLALIKAVREIIKEKHLIIEAAAGYGKTVFLKQLTWNLANSQYVRLTIADNDLVLLKARFEGIEAKTILVDDVHLLSPDSEATAWLKEQLELVDRTYVLAGRGMPFDFVYLTATGIADRWDEKQLAFSPQLSAQLLDGQNVVALAGWPLGIGLLRQLPVEQRQIEKAKDHFFEYFTRRIFRNLTAELQAFLLVTAVPLTFSTDLAAALLNLPAKTAAAHLNAIQNRALFIYPDEASGTFTYHVLFRDFLRNQLGPERLVEISERLIAIYQDNHPGNGSTPEAIEQALDSQMYERAAELLLNLDWQHLWQTWTYRTVERWIMSLPTEIRDSHPDLYRIAGLCLRLIPQRTSEAFLFLERAEKAALELQDEVTAFSARLEKAIATFEIFGASQELAADLMAITRDAPQIANIIVRAGDVLQHVYLELGMLRTVQKQFPSFYARAEELGTPPFYLETMRWTGELVVPYLLGEYALSIARIKATLQRLDSSSGDYPRILFIFMQILLQTGNWDELKETAVDMKSALEQMPNDIVSQRFALEISAGWQYLVDENLEEAQNHFEQAEEAAARQQNLLHLGKYKIILFRKQQQLDKIEEIFASLAQSAEQLPYHYAMLNLEADIAFGLAAVENDRTYTVSKAALNLYSIRSRGELLRLRALLTVLCHAQGNRRWRMFAKIVLREIERPYYPQLLTRFDPELGAFFWRILLIEDVERDRAAAALIKIGLVAPLLLLLNHKSIDVRRLVVQILSEIGDEQAMPALNVQAKVEKDKSIQQRIRHTLDRIESLPPPPLYLQLMGGFRVLRGKSPVTEFHRPIVVRLLQYFAAQRGRFIPRDRLLEDLWPDSPPDKAWTTFKTVYSRLRSALEPFMRNKGPNRYFALSGDSYIFDPHNRVTVDVEIFNAKIGEALSSSAPFSPEHVKMVAEYVPILPDIPYADWLLDLREQTTEILYDARLRIGQEHLAYGEPESAQQWAQLLLSDAPWMEAGWQLLMRAYARQNRRSRALRTYEEAQATLSQELGVEPAPLTHWLYQRLQAGEDI